MKSKSRRVKTSSSKKTKLQTIINWDELDRYYSEQYESDYGHLFQKSKLEHRLLTART